MSNQPGKHSIPEKTTDSSDVSTSPSERLYLINLALSKPGPKFAPERAAYVLDCAKHRGELTYAQWFDLNKWMDLIMIPNPAFTIDLIRQIDY